MSEIALVAIAVGVWFTGYHVERLLRTAEGMHRTLQRLEESLTGTSLSNERLLSIRNDAAEAAKRLKSIEERLEPFTETRLQRLFADLWAAANPKKKTSDD